MNAREFTNAEAVELIRSVNSQGFCGDLFHNRTVASREAETSVFSVVNVTARTYSGASCQHHDSLWRGSGPAMQLRWGTDIVFMPS